MSADYVIPFGLDPKEFDAGIAGMEKQMDSLVSASQEAQKEIQNSINTSIDGAEKLNQTLQTDTKTLKQVREEAKQMGAALNGALNSGTSQSEVEKKLERFSQLIGSLQSKAKSGIKLEADVAKFQAFEAALASGADELEVLNQLLDFTKEKLAGLDPNSAEFAELNTQLQAAEGFMEGLGIGTTETTEKTKSLKAQLREMKVQLAEMEMAGQGGTAEFRALSEQAGELEDQIGDVSQRVRVLASDTKYLDAGVQALQGLAGGFAAAQGAAALFGSENENVNEVIKKVTGAMAILQGIQAVANALNKDSALSVLFLGRAQTAQTVTTTTLAGATTAEAVATTGATTATRGFTAALLANPITLVLVAIVAIVSALIAFSSSSDDAKDATKDLNDELERQNQLLTLEENRLKRRTELLVATAKLAGKSESEITKIQGQGLADRRNLVQSEFNDFIRNSYNNQALRQKVDKETNDKIEKQYLDYTENLKDMDNDLAVQRLNFQKQQKDEGVAAAKKAEENSKKAIEARKKQEEEERKMIDQRIKYLKEIRENELALMTDQFDKERVAAADAANEKVQTLNNEKQLSEENQKLRAEAITKINANLYRQLDEIDKKEAAARLELLAKTSQLQVDLMEEGAAKELAGIKSDFAARRRQVEEDYKDDEANRVKLIQEVNAAEIVAMQKAKDRLAVEALSKEGERAELEVDIAEKFVGKIPHVEEQKQLAILEVKLKYAKKALELLLSQGKAENSIEVLNAKKVIQDLEKGIKDGTKDLDKKSGKGIFNLQKILFGDQGDEGNAGIAKALQATYEGVQQITDFIVAQYQRQIDARQAVIDSYDDQIDALEDQLDEEKDLRDQGFANDVGRVEAELDEKKRLRDEEFQKQQELLEKQKAAQRVQLTIDTAVQASNLITAVTEIFAAMSGIPFVGVALAIAAAGVMIGAFVAAKVSAYQAIGDAQSFGEGGTIDGKSHAAGGQRYVSADGSGGVVELEAGEKVTNKRQSGKFAEVLDAINDDSLTGLSDEALRRFLAECGIALESDSQRKIVATINERDELKQIVVNENETPEELVSIREDVAYLANRKRNDAERWEDDKYTYEKRGNKISKMRKK